MQIITLTLKELWVILRLLGIVVAVCIPLVLPIYVAFKIHPWLGVVSIPPVLIAWDFWMYKINGESRIEL